LRSGDAESANSETSPSGSTGPSRPEEDKPDEKRPEQRSGPPKRPGKDLAFQAEIVRGVSFEKLPPKPKIPKGYVRTDPSRTLPTTFNVSSFNLLGHGHTVRGGNRKGWAGGQTRMQWQVSLLRAHDVSVAGFQEFQAPQFNTFQAIAGGEYGVFPGLSMGQAPVQNSIVWRTSDWELVEAGTTPIPYFDGHRLPMPHVLLRNTASGKEVWFTNYHNPADAHGPAGRWRSIATSIEVGLVNRLGADGTPVVMTGDFNERADFFCRVAVGAHMISANGGYADASGCHPPARMDVDWIVGTAQLAFSDFVADRGPLVSRSTDHPMLRSQVTLAPEIDRSDCMRHPVHESRLYCRR
ncbi:MAG TPA: hypothetical protein VFI77_03645, partial [Gemmatimonadales bacterium]|nr:hypothetical protein [Gemmatimonadales bacterium]